MAGDDQDKKSSFVVLYLLTVLLGLTLAVTIYVFAYPEELFLSYKAPASVLEPNHGYTDVHQTSTGKRPVRYMALPLNGEVKIEPAKSGGYDITLTVFTVTNNESKPYVPHKYSVRVFQHGREESSGFTPLFNNPSPGVYTSHVTFPAPGYWDIHVQLNYETDDDTTQKILEFTETQNIK